MSCRAHQVSWRKQMPQQLVVPISLKASHTTSNRNTTAPVWSCAWGSVCAGELHFFVIPTNLPSQADLGLKAFYADFPIPLGNMGQSPLAALPKAQWYAEAGSPSFFPLCNTAMPSLPSFQSDSCMWNAWKDLTGLQFHTEAKHHPSAAGSQSPEAGAEQLLIGSSWWQNPASLQGNSSWLFLSSGRILTSFCLPWNTSC